MASKLIILTIILAIKSAATENKNLNGTICDTLRYRYEVDDPPDLLVEHGAILDTYTKGICRFGSSDIQLVSQSKYQPPLKGMTYDPHTKTIYKGSDDSIEKMDLDGSNIQVVYSLDEILQDKIGPIEDIAIDWITQNLYICFDKAVGVINLNESGPLKTLKLLFNSSDTSYHLSRISVHPNKGYFFVIYRKSEILRFNLDGSDKLRVAKANETLPHFNLREYRALTLDYYEDRIYWATDYPGRAILHSKLDGSDQNIFQLRSNPHIYALAVDKFYVYFRPTCESVPLLRIAKDTGDDSRFSIKTSQRRLAPLNFLVNLKQPQDVEEEHPCKDNNGECPKFCFAVPNGNSGKLIKKCDV